MLAMTVAGADYGSRNEILPYRHCKSIGWHTTKKAMFEPLGGYTQAFTTLNACQLRANGVAELTRGAGPRVYSQF